MYPLTTLAPVDYLVIGHITCDLTPHGSYMGGTASYAALTARAFGLRVGIVTSWVGDIEASPLRGIPVSNFPTEYSSTFENIYGPDGRKQYLHHVASRLDYNMIPEAWRNANIVHLAPLTQEIEPAIVRNFPSSKIVITPQGWLRSWSADGLVSVAEWPEAQFVLEHANATSLSVEDVGRSEARIEEMAASCHLLVITEGEKGCRVYWNGDVRRFPALSVPVVDPTGAGDIFAAVFFVILSQTQDPWEAARVATRLATLSVTRSGLNGIPTSAEIEACRVEVI